MAGRRLSALQKFLQSHGLGNKEESDCMVLPVPKELCCYGFLFLLVYQVQEWSLAFAAGKCSGVNV